jgi:hypothetical protein
MWLLLIAYPNMIVSFKAITGGHYGERMSFWVGHSAAAKGYGAEAEVAETCGTGLVEDTVPVRKKDGKV